jgi:hypothetical protein
MDKADDEIIIITDGAYGGEDNISLAKEKTLS